MKTKTELINALLVLTQDPLIRRFLEANAPNALAQAERALRDEPYRPFEAFADEIERPSRAKRIRSLVEDSGYSRADATRLVDANFGEL